MLFSFFFILFSLYSVHFSFFFFNDTATTEIYTLSLHDALPILARAQTTLKVVWMGWPDNQVLPLMAEFEKRNPTIKDRKSTRLNSSHDQISYAVFCLKKKKKYERQQDNERMNR